MKTLITFLAISLVTLFSAHAQVAKKTEVSATQTTAQSQQEISKQAQDQALQMTRDLDLSPEQVDRVMAVTKTLYSNISSLRETDTSSEDYKKRLSGTITNYDSHLKNILDEAQYGTYQNMKPEYLKGLDTPIVVDKQKKAEW